MNECTEDSILIETYFIDGPLGVTLKRRPNDGAVFVYNLVEGSQSIGKNIELQDELWSVGSTFLGVSPFYKADWDNLISIIQNSKRPLRIVWRRRKPVVVIQSQPPTTTSAATTATRELIQPQQSLESTDVYAPVSETPSIGVTNNTQDNDDNNGNQLPSYEQSEMKELASRLIFPTNKDKSSKQTSSSSSSSSSAAYRQPDFILRSNQRILITSYVFIESKILGNNNNNSSSSGSNNDTGMNNVNFFNTLWGVGNSSSVATSGSSGGVGGNKRFLILLTDTLLVTIPLSSTSSSVSGGSESCDMRDSTIGSDNASRMLRVEHIINLVSCKLSYPSATTATTNNNYSGVTATSSRHPTIDSISAAVALTPLQHFQQSVIDTTQQLSSTKTNMNNNYTNNNINNDNSFMVTWPLGQMTVILKSSSERDFWCNKILNTATELTGYDNQYHLIGNNSSNNSYSNTISTTGNPTLITTVNDVEDGNDDDNNNNNNNNNTRDNLINSNEPMLTADRYNNNNSPTNKSPSPTTTMNNTANNNVINNNYRYRLHEAVINNNETKLKSIINDITNNNNNNNNSGSSNSNNSTSTVTIDIDETNDEGYTALHYACIFQHHNLISLLYSANANICYVDSSGYSPLHWSALLFDYKALNILLSTIIDPDLNDNDDRTPLLLACAFGHNHHHRSLVYCDNNSTSNSIAKKKLKKLNSKKIKNNNNSTTDRNSHTTNNTTASSTPNCIKIISPSTRKALQKSLSCLLSRRADPSTADIETISALHYLAASWQYESIQLLTRAEVNVFKMSSCNDGNSSSSSSNTNATETGGDGNVMQSVLHYAVLGSILKINEYIEVCTLIEETKKKALSFHATSKSLQKKIMNDNNTNNTNNNQMIVSVEKYEKYKYDIKYGVKTIRVLLRAGCRPNRRNSEGKVPLQLLLHSAVSSSTGAGANWKKSRILEAACVLILYGARIELLDPSEQNLLKKLGGGRNRKGKGENTKGNNDDNEESNNNKNDDDNSNNDSSENNSTDDNSENDDNNNSDNDNNSENEDDDEDNEEEELFRQDLLFMTSIEKAVEGWMNKTELAVDSIGLRAGSLKIEDDGHTDDNTNNTSNSNPFSSSCVFPNDGKDKCILCSAGFTLFKRQHHCRLCNILCCDDCSRKRVIISHSKKERVCDSCYNIATYRLQERLTRQQLQKKNINAANAGVLATISCLTLTTGGSGTSQSSDDEGEENSDDGDDNKTTTKTNTYAGNKSNYKNKNTNRASESDGSSDNDNGNGSGSNKSSARGRQSPLTLTTGITAAATAVDASARSLLFGQSSSASSTADSPTVNSKTTPTKFTTTKFAQKPTSDTTNTTQQKQAQQNVSQSIRTMNEINERLKKRGEKLSEIGDRTEKLSNQSSEFAKMAKELKAQQQRRNSFLGFLG